MSAPQDSRDGGAFLARVYAAQDKAELKAIYDDWAESYDADMTAWGYVGRPVVTGLVGRHLPPGEAPLLDAGCGTGELGRVLHPLGYRALVGIDLSTGMLARAEALGVYQACREMTLGLPLDFPDDHFIGAIAAGVFTAGHAGPEALEELVRVTRPGGVLIFSLSETVYEPQGFKETLGTLESDGRIAFADASDWARVLTNYPGKSPPQHRIFVYRVS